MGDGASGGPLTARQAEALRAIESFIAAHGYPPTVRDLMAPLGAGTPSGVAVLLWPLERKGRIRRVPGVARGMVVIRGSGEG
jgi:repressor LexA